MMIAKRPMNAGVGDERSVAFLAVDPVLGQQRHVVARLDSGGPQDVRQPQRCLVQFPVRGGLPGCGLDGGNSVRVCVCVMAWVHVPKLSQ